jgi:Uma2 family endonuclease
MTSATHEQEFRELTIEQYHSMIAHGVLPEGEPYELIDGKLRRKNRSRTGEDPMTVGDQHTWVVKKLAKLDRQLDALGCHMQTQQPIVLPPRSEPEPDGSIIRGSDDDYAGIKPTAADVLCVIEVADSSLQYDRTIKVQMYASAQIQQYVIFNLVDMVVEVYSEPVDNAYGRPLLLHRGQEVAFRVGDGKTLNVPVDRLLPAGR